tara:strand:+ start:1504 stop:1914 length:411 start_codon:yes stop_codon:yes gene_type:complete
MTITCVLIIEYKKSFLLQLRDNKKNIPEMNKWGFFGGKKEKTESNVKCIKREILEELNYKISKPFYIGKIKHKKYLINIFFKKTRRKSFKINEGSGYGFFKKSQIINNNCKLKSSGKKYLLGKSSLKVFKYFTNKS